ncbi:MAG: AMP-binding protein [Sneathiella sp.]
MSQTIPFRKLNRPLPDISVKKVNDGSYLIKSNIAIGDYENNAAAFWLRAAEAFPDRAFLVRCGPEENWPELTYGEARAKADQISSWLLRNDYSADTPIMLLSSNSFAHALLSMGALQIGVPIVPVSPSFSLMSGDFAKLKYAVDLTRPKMIFAEDASLFGAALDVADSGDLDVVVVAGDRPECIAFEKLLGEGDGGAVQEAVAAVNGDTLAKIMFTSGSTGMPKAVPNTHRMICSSQKMHDLISEPKDPINDPVTILDWLPWHHTYGGNVNFFGIMRLLGTLYMDDGKPIPGLFDKTIRNLARVKPTRFNSVPTAFSFLLDELEQNDDLAKAFFERVKLCGYGGAALSQELFERMQVLAIQYTGVRMPFATGWGSTETTGTGTAVYWETEKVGLIGVPYSGVDVKLVPVSDKYEIRIKGPHVHTGYFKRPDLTEEYFDEEGFYCIGDAVKFEDTGNLEQGLVFSGRVSEDFKLANGTWVETGSLRLTLIDALDPVARDVVIAGHDRENMAILIVPSESILKEAAGVGHDANDVLSTVQEENLLALFRERLAAYNQNNPGKSRFVARALVMAVPLSADKNEITDKQYINQSAVLQNRAQLVERLYSDITSTDILSFK